MQIIKRVNNLTYISNLMVMQRSKRVCVHCCCCYCCCYCCCCCFTVIFI